MVEKISAFHDPEEEEEEEEEEALSLCDLAMDENVTEFAEMGRIRSPSDPGPELFEFLSNVSSDSTMCPAEDMIFCGGRLVSSSSSQPSIKTLSRDDNKVKQAAFRRRSESLSELQTSSSATRSGSTRSGNGNYILRSSRSLDYQRLRRLSSSKSSHEDNSDMERNPSVRRPDRAKSASSVASAASAARPRWYLPMFGIAKFPPEMDLRDIKSRQFRRNSSSVMFPPSSDSTSSSNSSDGFPGHRGSGKASWRFLKALSCKDHASIAVTTPFYVPQV